MSLLEAPLILAIDTATPGGSVALLSERDVVAASSWKHNRNLHSREVLDHLGEVFRVAGAQVGDVDLFAVSSGPGSFTGLRIGVATAKAFGATLKRPCAGVHTLQATARAAKVKGMALALIPAGRGEFYAQLYEGGGDGLTHASSAARSISLPDLLSLAEGVARPLVWIGQGIEEKVGTVIEHARRRGIDLARAGANDELPQDFRGWIWAGEAHDLAVEVAFIGREMLRRGLVTSAEGLEAIYVRPPDVGLSARDQGLPS